MRIIDLNETYESLYFLCLEDWSSEIKEAGEHKKEWYQKMKENGLRVKLALDNNGEVGGMIQSDFSISNDNFGGGDTH